MWGGPSTLTSLTIEICSQTHNEHEICNEKSEPDDHKSKSKISETREVNRVVRDTNRDKKKKSCHQTKRMSYKLI